MRTSPPKQTKTYWILTQDDDLYKKGKYINAVGFWIADPAAF